VRPCLEKPYHKKIGLVEWLKVKTLNPSPSMEKKLIFFSFSILGPNYKFIFIPYI
jgi:hypothetical protein